MSHKTVLISGGSSGIGKSIVTRLLSEGFNVATFSYRNQDQQQLELSLQFPTERYLVLNVNVTKEQEVTDVVQKTVEKFGFIDILINNAGVGYFSDVDTFDLTLFKSMIEVNIVGITLLTKHVVPVMKQQRNGYIINMASICGKEGDPNGEFYAATKFAVMGYSDTIRKELGKYNIKICTVCPGMVDTPFFSKQIFQEIVDKFYNGIAPPMLNVEDVSKVVSFICAQSDYCEIRDITIMPIVQPSHREME